jgi:two-component system, LuxR family, sensor kinase FixL
MPHGYCFEWRPGVLWLHVLSDLSIAIAYFCIPFVLFYFIRKRRDLPFQPVFWLFGAFILLCGTTHLLSIWVLWHADYYVEGAVKAMTAMVSVATLIAIIVTLPRALGLRGTAEMVETNVRLEALVASSTDAIMSKTLDGIVTSWNAAAEKLFGYSAADMIGQPMARLIPPDRAEEEILILGNIRDGLNVEAFETVRRKKTGELIPISVTISPIKDAAGAIIGASKIARDITDRKIAETAAEQLLVRLTESNTELERFAYVASHDMQEPLRMVLNFSEVIVRDYAHVLDADGKEYLNFISESAGRIRDMVEDLLEYSKLGREKLNFSDVDADAELLHVLVNLTESIAETKAVITSDELPMLNCNAVQIMRLLQNLVANAIKFQHPGQAPAIHIGVRRENEQWLFSVRDNGLGIDPAFIEQIFEPYRRLHTWEAIKGTGLGLAVCRKIVENHGGRIWATSTPGKGSTMFFTLP